MLDLFIRWPKKRFNSKRNLVDIHNYKEKMKRKFYEDMRRNALCFICIIHGENSKAFRNERMNIERVRE